MMMLAVNRGRSLGGRQPGDHSVYTISYATFHPPDEQKGKMALGVGATR